VKIVPVMRPNKPNLLSEPSFPLFTSLAISFQAF
jgi:hypothetical protein